MASYEEVFVLEAENLHGECIGGDRLSPQFDQGSLRCFLYVVLVRNQVRFAVLFSDPNGGWGPMHVFSGLSSATKITFVPFLIHVGPPRPLAVYSH